MQIQISHRSPLEAPTIATLTKALHTERNPLPKMMRYVDWVQERYALAEQPKDRLGVNMTCQISFLGGRSRPRIITSAVLR